MNDLATCRYDMWFFVQDEEFPFDFNPPVIPAEMFGVNVLTLKWLADASPLETTGEPYDSQ